MKSIIFYAVDETLMHFNLSHMDFLDDPAAIHGSKLITSNTRKDASSNELINPEISSNNHLKFIYSFGLILLAITLACKTWGAPSGGGRGVRSTLLQVTRGICCDSFL